jgi:anti-sigma factor RsiW
MTDPLTCGDARELVEPIASGDVEVDARLRAHFESCPRCAAALATARRIETALAARAAPDAPPRFKSAVLARVRRERWRSEQRVDRIFNLGIAAAVLLMVGGLAALLNVSGVLAAAGATWEVLSTASQHALERAAPAVKTYVAAAAFMMSALVMWWWAERRLSL